MITQEEYYRAYKFGIIYGSTPDFIKQKIGMSLEEAEEMFKRWRESYPELVEKLRSLEANLKP